MKIISALLMVALWASGAKVLAAEAAAMVAGNTTTTGNATAMVYANSRSGISIEVPPGWAANGIDTSTDWNEDHWVLQVNNQDPNLRLNAGLVALPLGGGGSGTNVPPDAAILKLLAPGSIYFALVQPNTAGMAIPPLPEAGANVKPFLTGNIFTPSAEKDLTKFYFRFFWRDHLAEVRGYLHEPVSAASKRELLEILNSLRLEVGPVETAGRAAKLALLHLPADIPELNGFTDAASFTRGPGGLSREMRGVMRDHGFDVTITLYAPQAPKTVGPPTQKAGEWKFRVEENGEVKAVSAEFDREKLKVVPLTSDRSGAAP